MGRRITDSDDEFEFVTEFDDQLVALWDKLPSLARTQRASRVPLDGVSFERFCQTLLAKQGFDVRTTPATGDHGADLIARKGRYTLAIQCKNHGKPVGNHAVMEAESARQFYDCTNAVVVSDSGFTTAARQHANKVGVTLLDSQQLSRLRKAMLRPPRQQGPAAV